MKKRKEKNNLITKILLGLILVILGYLFGYFMGNILSANETQKEANELKEEEISKIKSKLLLKYDYESNNTAEFEYDNNNYKLSMEEEKNGYINVVLNDKIIYQSVPGPDDNIFNIYLIGDLITLELYGSDVRTGALLFIDFEGTIVKELRTIEENNLIFALAGNINIIDNRITVQTTAITHGLTLVTKNEIIEDILPYNDEIKSKYKITDNTIIEATYTFKYLDNNKFSEPEIIEKTTYKEFIEENYNLFEEE